MKLTTILQGKGIFLLLLLFHTESIAKINASISGSKEKRWCSQSQMFAKQELGNMRFHSDLHRYRISPYVFSPPGFVLDSKKLLFRRIQATTHPIQSNESDCVECPKNPMEGDNELILSLRGGDLLASQATVETVGIKPLTPYNIPLKGWKVIFQIILTTINVVCWLVPLRQKHLTQNGLALSLANTFSGGVFLSLAFGHLLPECVHGFHGYNQAMPYMIVLSGYLLIFFIEKVAFDTHSMMCEKDHDDSIDVEAAAKGRGAVILLCAIAVHSVLEMTALGLADSFSDSAILALSIGLHQPAESIALLIAFLKSGMQEKTIIQYLSAFTAVEAIGVGIGIAVKEFAAPILESIMLALVAGTFVYVGATEVIPEEWEKSDNKWKKFACLMTGIVSIFVLTQYSMTLENKMN